MIDYGALPPEVNSGRMYAGAGAGPMLAAATAWDVLAGDWSSTAAAFESTVLDLTAGPWRGPSATSMAAAALPFTLWLKATAAHAEQAALQAKAAVAAYEAAFAMTVPPALVAANRAQLMLLVATNFFGQNTAAIAATEAHYAAMWAQDAAAMYTYAGSSQAARQVSQFSAPPQTTNPTGVAGQSAATGQGVGTAPASPAAAVPHAVAQLGSSTAPGATTPPASVLTGLDKFFDQWSLLNRYTGAGFSPALMAPAVSQIWMMGDTFPKALSGVKDFLADATKAAEAAAKSFGTAAPQLGSALPAVGGTAAKIGALSVPQSWPGATPAAGQAAAALVAHRAAASAAGEAGALSRGGLGMPFLPGAAAAGGAHGFRFVPRYGYRHRVMTRPPHAG